MSTREKILHTALELINDKGYVHVGVREIARALKKSPGNISYHFSKKEDILIALLEQYRETNSALYEDYFAGQPSAHRFLELMKGIFDSQFRYRGVFIGNQFVKEEIQSGNRYDYRATYQQRLSGFTRIFRELRESNHLQVSDEDIEFLVAHIALVGRFWIYEATLFDKSPNQESTVKHYLDLLARQISLFATPLGAQDLSEFRVSQE